ncbi:MAG: hypothetical protein HWN67_01280 [Candidatus Helarchaeota archaeon]|nr:hypothetical protein [Candidatus Helarchaeota archaeon]
MKPYTYGDIPDSIPTKRFICLGENLWNLFKELGWGYFDQEYTDTDLKFFQKIPEFLSDKFQRTVQTAKKCMDGKIEDPEKVFTTWFFPPVLYVRSDLQMGTTKLIYGNSTDITFIIINDINYDIELLVNGHMEDGIPVDYWIIKRGDELFDRRHMKLGFKLREIPKKTKGFVKSGFRILDVLRDVRNERSPQWFDSAYSMCMVWASGATNMFLESSNYNSFAELWDGINAQKIYGMPDMWFGLVPWPPILKMLFSMGRPELIIRLAGLLSHNRLFINAYEPKHMHFMKTVAPEGLKFLIRNIKEIGIPTPRHSLGCNPPDLKNKKKFENEEFDFFYPSGTRIMPYEWDITDEEVFSGIYTDITHETPSEPFYGKEHIISMGIGK